jgi:quercetin dioxygenase-like cupin family protein
MALTHAKSGELIDVRPLGQALANESTRTLAKTQTLEIVRLVMRSGKVHRAHKVAGEITVQCLEGRCTFTAGGATRDLEPGRLIYLAGGEEHSLQATEDCSLLLTILLARQEG